MKFYISLLLFVLLSACSSTGRKITTNIDGSQFQLPPYQEETLANGMRIIFIEDNALPYISFGLLLKSGSSSDPQGMSGTAHLVAELLDQGTRTKSATDVANRFAQMGSDLKVNVDKDYTYVMSSGLSTSQKELLTLFADCLRAPALSEKEFKRTSERLIAEIKSRSDQPAEFTRDIFDSFLFEKHPYGHSPEGSEDGVRKIKRLDLVKFYSSHYRPNNMILTVVGQINPAIRQDVVEAFQDWKAGEVVNPLESELAPIKGKQILLVDKGDLVQTQLSLGHYGIARSNQDFLTVRLSNHILGGGFSSRLIGRIRKDLGLTYSISSSFEALLQPGSFQVNTFTRNDKVGETLTETLAVLRNFRDQGVSNAEVESAKALLKGTFPRSIETGEKLAFNLAILRLYNVPDTYLRDYMKNIDAISTRDVNRIIKKYYDPDNIKIVMFTNSKVTKPQVENIGQVDVKNYRLFF